MALFDTVVEQRRLRIPGHGHFDVVAAPGESMPTLEHGDLLMQQPARGAAPRIVRIASAPAVAEDFFFDGIMVEKGRGGLYVEVAGPNASPAAWRIGDSSGRMTRGTLVLRRSAPMDSFREDLREETDPELQKRRAALVADITRSDIYWSDVPLAGGYRIQVSAPLMKDDLLVPVTQGEALKLAAQFEVLPLTRAVMDQAHNVAVKVDKPQSPSSLFDFVTYSSRLKNTAYYMQFGYALTSGAHKLWVASSRGPVVNYGFYIPRVRGEMVRCGPYLDPQYNVIQSLGARHNALHWDYSQLLQFMTGLRDPDGQSMNLRQALLDRNPAVWDEARPPSAGSLP